MTERVAGMALVGLLIGAGLGWSIPDPADVNRDGRVNVLDVQLVVNEYLGR